MATTGHSSTDCVSRERVCLMKASSSSSGQWAMLSASCSSTSTELIVVVFDLCVVLRGSFRTQFQPQQDIPCCCGLCFEGGGEEREQR
eukprot:m.23426 g.23426  ORF g.23426 m.23426 type:complete len:88 (-) comp11047_c0_seq1:16-279(-)